MENMEKWGDNMGSLLFELFGFEKRMEILAKLEGSGKVVDATDRFGNVEKGD